MTTVRFDIVYEGTYATQVTEKGGWLFSDEESFAPWRERMLRDMSSDSSLSQIDFDTHQVLLVSMGTQSSGGYAIKSKRVYFSKQRLHLDVEEVQPGAGCMSSMALTAPFQVLRIDRTTAETLEVHRTTSQQPCP